MEGCWTYTSELLLKHVNEETQEEPSWAGAQKGGGKEKL